MWLDDNVAPTEQASAMLAFLEFTLDWCVDTFGEEEGRPICRVCLWARRREEKAAFAMIRVSTKAAAAERLMEIAFEFRASCSTMFTTSQRQQARPASR